MFPQLTLTPHERTRYEQLAHGLIQDTLADYDVYNHDQRRQVSKARWKAVKSRENIAVYKDRAFDSRDANIHRGLASSGRSSTCDDGTRSASDHHHSAASSLSRSSRSSSALSSAIVESIPAEAWHLPELLMVGTLSGTLDDVMYGLATPDAALMLLKASYAQDEVIDGQVLAQIHGPSPSEPYRFLGLKWLVKGNPPAVNALVLPRDLILLETTGIMHHPTRTGERIGYFLMHSVSLPACPDLPKNAAVRGRISSCYIFKELSDGVVDVYMKGFVEASGKIVDAVAILSAANGLLCCWKAVVCSQSKKLAWGLRVKHKEDKRRIASGRIATPAEQRLHHLTETSHACGMCSKHFTMFNRVASCELCDAAMCSRCRVTMKLGFAKKGVKQIKLKNVTICKRCITSTNHQSTFEIAQQEVLSGRFGSLFASSSAAGVSTTFPSESLSSATNTRRGAKKSSIPSASLYSNPEDIGNSILLAHAQDRANTSFKQGTGSTVLLAHAKDHASGKLHRSKDASQSVASSQADTTKTSTMSESEYFFDSEDEPEYFEEDEEDQGAIAVSGEWGAISPTSRQQYLDNVQCRTPEEQAIWKRMAQLHFQAENLYQYTKKNTETLCNLTASTAPGVSIVPPSPMPRMSIE